MDVAAPSAFGMLLDIFESGFREQFEHLHQCEKLMKGMPFARVSSVARVIRFLEDWCA